MVRIEIVPRLHIEYILNNKLDPPKVPWALISINCRDDRLINKFVQPILTRKNCREILSLEFDDIILEETVQGRILFTESHAREIIRFINTVRLQDIDTLVIHCYAGVSRSGAVGIWACRFLDLDETELRDRHPWIYPNSYVLKTLMDVSGLSRIHVF